MALNTSRIDQMAGNDEVVSNQRVRAYVPGDPVASSVTGGQQYGTMWMQGTGVATSFASGAQTYTAAILGGGLIVHSNAGATAATLDTATNIINYMNNNSAGVQVGDILQCAVMNTGTATLTVSAGSGGALDANGSGAIPTLTSKMMNIRITNLATPAYIVYM
jgi:hypothetical protein